MKIKKAISLIVLVITIIVILILAGAIILTLSNNNVITKANEAVDKTNEKEIQTYATTKWAEAYSEGKRTKAELQNYILDELKKQNIDIDEYFIYVTEKGVTVIRSVVDVVDTVPIPKGFVASKATGENKKATGLVIYEGTYEVTDENVETAKRTRNQYVWVPVENFDEFKMNIKPGLTNLINYRLGKGVWEVEIDETTNLPKQIQSDMTYMTQETLEEVQAMYASVKKYKGFYMARYEAGLNRARTQTDWLRKVEDYEFYSMMEKYPYTRIIKESSTIRSGAIEIARAMYTNANEKYGVVSTLTYGVQWDATVNWLLASGALTTIEDNTSNGKYGLTEILADQVNNGAKFELTTGKYLSFEEVEDSIDSTKLVTTGALKFANINNIYDMAGNADEWIMAKIENYYLSAGGNYMNAELDLEHSDNAASIANYEMILKNTQSEYISFRTALYIK